MKTKKVIKVIGLTATAIGFIATIVNDWVNERKMEEIIDEKVNEALAEKDENEEEES